MSGSSTKKIEGGGMDDGSVRFSIVDREWIGDGEKERNV